MANDGSIRIAIEVDGKETVIAAKGLDKLEESGQKAGKGIKPVEDGLKGVGNESDKASGKTKKFAVSLGLIAIAATAFVVLKSSLDAAITRFDTLNKFPKVLQALGVSAEDSERSMKNLGDGIEGLPTTLGEIASRAQRMYSSFKDMDKATDTALALNNALLGSGSSAADAQRGSEQYMQVLERGKFEMQEWKTMQETMNVGLVEIAEGFGFAGRSATNDLYEALKSGDIHLQDFNDRLIEIGTGTGIMADLAKQNSAGIATSFGNLRNAAAKGIADIIKSFDELSIAVTGKSIAENIDGLKHIVNASFKAIGKAVEGATPFVKGFASVVKDLMPVVRALTPTLIGMATAYAIHAVIAKTTAAIKASETAMAIITVIKKLYTFAIKENTVAQLANMAAVKIAAVAQAAMAAVIRGLVVAELLLTGQIGLVNIAIYAKAVAIAVLNGAIKLLLGPIGWVLLAIGALAGAIVGIVKWFKKGTEEGKKMAKSTEELGESTDALNQSVADSSREYEKNQAKIKTNAKTNAELAKTIDELSKKENKSAADKKELTSYIDQLNSSVDGLNLVYGEEADALTMSSEQIAQRIGLMEKQEGLNTAQERLTEIINEQVEAEAKLEEVAILREEWNQKLADGTVKSGESKKALEALAEQEALLSETNTLAGEERIRVEAEIAESAKAVADATAESTGRQALLFDELSESQKTAVETMKTAWADYQAAASDMFDVLNEKSEISVGKMTENLNENQRIIGEWAANIATLAERGVDEGLLETLRAAGPESAGHVNALVKASDDELMKLSDAFSKSGSVATEALKTSIGDGSQAVMDEAGHLIVSTQESLNTAIKSADFEGIGGDVTAGLAGGIKDGTKDATDASKQMADDTTDAAKDAFQTKSPSKVFKGIGENLPEGLVLGINSGTTSVIQAMQKLSKSSIDQFKNSQSQFRSIGVNSMLGLNQGLLSGRAQVLATARGIANSIVGTMQSALRIHSPSRRMEDEVGEESVAGVTVGIEKNAKHVYRALDNMASNMVAHSSPETALGTGRMARNAMTVNGGSMPGGTGRGNTTNTNTVSVQTLVVREEADIKKVARELFKMQQGNGRVVLG